MARVFDTNMFDRTSPPLSIAEGGTGNPFQADSFKQAMEKGDSYVAAINLGFINEIWTALPGLPQTNEKVLLLTSETPYSPQGHVVQVEGPKWDPMKHMGACT